MRTHFISPCYLYESESEVAQSSPTLCGPMESVAYQASPSMGFSRQAILEWVAISFSNLYEGFPVKTFPVLSSLPPNLLTFFKLYFQQKTLNTSHKYKTVKYLIFSQLGLERHLHLIFWKTPWGPKGILQFPHPGSLLNSSFYFRNSLSLSLVHSRAALNFSWSKVGWASVSVSIESIL